MPWPADDPWFAKVRAFLAPSNTRLHAMLDRVAHVCERDFGDLRRASVPDRILDWDWAASYEFTAITLSARGHSRMLEYGDLRGGVADYCAALRLAELSENKSLGVLAEPEIYDDLVFCLHKAPLPAPLAAHLEHVLQDELGVVLKDVARGRWWASHILQRDHWAKQRDCGAVARGALPTYTALAPMAGAFDVLEEGAWSQIEERLHARSQRANNTGGSELGEYWARSAHALVAQRRAAAVVAALSAYRYDRGHYPVALVELVPDYLDEEPTDLNALAPFDYVLDAAGDYDLCSYLPRASAFPCPSWRTDDCDPNDAPRSYLCARE